MQCPNCLHIPLAGNQPDPNVCPKCNVPYIESIRKNINDSAISKHTCQDKSSSAKRVHNDIKQKMIEYPGAHPVVVLDVNMSFMSMVVFMVKWALASIPALIVVFAIYFVFIAVFGQIISRL